MVGESWLIDIELTGELDEQGMVVDFGIVKKIVRDYLDKNIDHCLVVPTQLSGCTVKVTDDQCQIEFTLQSGKSITHHSPKQALCFVQTDVINKSSVKEFLMTELTQRLPDNVSALKIRLYGEPHLREYYQYSHGLSQHSGNCQRIAHGHRSGLNISIDSELSERWRDYWIDCWNDIYLGTVAHLDIEADHAEPDYHHFHYQAAQGNFYLKMPKELCYLMKNATTVENIAEHLHQKMQKLEANKNIEVRAFEGIGKGAIVRA